MFERTRQRLAHLNRKAGRRIVRQPVILSPPVSEFGLQKKVVALHHSRAIRCRQPLPDSSLKIMPPLIRRIDSSKSHAQRQFGQRRSPILLPRRAVKKVRNRCSLVNHRAILTRDSSPHPQTTFPLLPRTRSARLGVLSRFSHLVSPLPSLTRNPGVCCNVCATQRGRS